MYSRSSSASAVKFEGIRCDNCGRREILGTRWKCELCFDYDLCDDCYKMGMHYRDHPFLLLKRPGDTAERVPPRTTSGRVPSSPISESGLIFYGITCDACGKNNISGVRWMCDECFNYDLCSVCYAANKHDNHAFVRFDRPRGKGIRVSPRKMSTGVESGRIVHEGINCDSCGESGIHGTRWKCLQCFDFDLCNACYARGRHDQEHAFLSLEKPGGVAKRVPPRKTTFIPQVCYLEPGGPRFDGVSCDFCHDSILGPRWKCEVCTDYDLCSTCYLSNVHDIDHAFVRFDGPHSRGVRVLPRHQSTDTEELEALLHEGIRCDACGEAGIYGKRWKCQFCYAYDLCFTFYGLRCDGCGLRAFSGARWKCDVCDDYDLCTACYISDKHNVGHFFVRYDSIFEEGIKVDPNPETPAPNTAGICHKGTNCDGCGERGIIGTRWKCELCYDFDLCTTCYASGKHEQEHSFLRVNRPGETAINVKPRKRSTRLAVNHLPRGGVRFHGISCNACGKAEITGTRWKCCVCANYNMCSRCYLSNTHNSEHSFVRFDRPRGQGMKVSAKQASPELDATGIAQEDVQFKGITCDVCGERDIIGTRWKCVMCHDYDLCTTCYAGGKHELSHAFLRFEVPGGRGLSVPPRQQPIRRTQPECTVVEDKVDKEEESRKEEAPSPDGDHPAQAELETKLRELEITVQCVICMERRRDVAFLCGHSACSECASSLTTCHMCRVPITRRITLY